MKHLIICALFMNFFVCNAQTRKLPAEFYTWLESKGMKHATVSLEITRLKPSGNEIIYSYDNERSVQPASVMKLLTTATVLSVLDTESTIKTEVGYTGTIEGGVLKGDLIIKGYGNAMLSSSYSKYPKEAFAIYVADAVKRLGISSIEGNIIGDGSIMKESPVSSEWTWEDMGNHYAQSISGLNYADNKYEILLNTSKRGQKPSVVFITPEVDSLIIENQLLSVDYPFDSAYVYGAPYQNLRVLYGAVPHRTPTFKLKGDVPDPAMFAASSVKKKLIDNGINVNGSAWSHRSVTVPDNYEIIYTHSSEPLSYIAKQTNVFSVNLLAESLLRQLAIQKGNGSETDGINTIYSFLKSQKLDTDGIQIFDGCGLAPADRVTTHFMVELLGKMKSNKAFYDSFPVAGRSGTIHAFLKNTRLDGKARLKTGTTKAVIAYTGYVECGDGSTYAVSIIVNNHTAKSTIVRKNIEKMLLLLIPS